MTLAIHPTQVTVFEQKVHQRFPLATIDVDAPSNPNGLWFIDVNLQGHSIVVQWKELQGFAITTNPSDEAYGERPHETFQDEENAFKRITSLLLGKTNTSPPEAVRLSELRSSRGISQVELAELLQVQQAAISKMESRKNNILISTLKSVVTAMGGELLLTVRFPDGVEKQLQLNEGESLSEEPSSKTAAVAGRRQNAQ